MVRPTVSAALIVRDEEQTLGRCLDSVAASVDEVVVVDTGSRDGTKAVAARYGARIFDFEWRDDFAAARQFSFDQATGAWVLWLDADDVVFGSDRIRPMIADAPQDVTGFYWRYILGRDSRQQPRFDYWRERCVKNDGTARWQGRVHEVLVSKTSSGFVKTDEVFVEHHPIDRPDQASDRNLRILEDECRGDNPEPRLLFYLGREYADHGNLPRAVETLQRYASVGRWDDELYLAQTQIGDLLRAQGKFVDAREAYWAALKIHPGWPDAYFGLSAIAYFQQDWKRVVEWAEIGRSRPRPDTLLFVNALAMEFSWIIYYTNALYHLGRIEEAREWTRKALSIVADDAWHLHNEQFLAGAGRVAGAPRLSEPGSAPR